MSQKDLSKIREDTKDLASTDIRELYFVRRLAVTTPPSLRSLTCLCLVPFQQLSENSRSIDAWDDSAPSAPPKPIPKANRRDRKKGAKFEDQLKTTGDWEVIRVERPEGLAEWGEQPKTPEEKKAERERKLV